jgi:hypothetical protein
LLHLNTPLESAWMAAMDSQLHPQLDPHLYTGILQLIVARQLKPPYTRWYGSAAALDRPERGVVYTTGLVPARMVARKVARCPGVETLPSNRSSCTDRACGARRAHARAVC